MEMQLELEPKQVFGVLARQFGLPPPNSRRPNHLERKCAEWLIQSMNEVMMEEIDDNDVEDETEPETVADQAEDEDMSLKQVVAILIEDTGLPSTDDPPPNKLEKMAARRLNMTIGEFMLEEHEDEEESESMKEASEGKNVAGKEGDEAEKEKKENEPGEEGKESSPVDADTKKMQDETPVGDNGSHHINRFTSIRELKSDLCHWAEDHLRHGIPISDAELQSKAVKLNEQRHAMKKFVASRTWIQKFKRDYHIDLENRKA